MKTLIIIIFLSANCYSSFSQVTDKSREGFVLDFLKYIKRPDWNFDTLTKKYVVFRNDESPKLSRRNRKIVISLAIYNVSAELQKVNLDELIVKPYSKADTSLQKMFLDKKTQKISYVAYSRDLQYKRYFLFENNKIVSFLTTKQGKVFLLLN
jgi:hypothetical protein